MPLYPPFPSGTTSKAGLLVLDGTASDIQPSGAQAAGSNGNAADSGHVHPATAGWVPSDNGLLGANSDMASISIQGNALTAGTLYLAKLNIRYPLTIANLVAIQGTAGVGTSTGSFVGLYSSAGTLLSGSSDQVSNFTNYVATLPLTTPQALAAGTFVWAAFLSNLSSSQPQFMVAFGSPANTGISNTGLTAATANFSTNGTGLTSLPSSITPSSNSVTVGQGIWVGYK